MSEETVKFCGFRSALAMMHGNKAAKATALMVAITKLFVGSGQMHNCEEQAIHSMNCRWTEEKKTHES